TTGADIEATIGTESFAFNGASQHTFLAVSGEIDLGLSAGPVVATFAGNLSFERSSLTVNGVATTVIRIAITGGSTSLSVSGAGLDVTGIEGALLLNNQGVAGKLTVGGLAVSGISGLTVSLTTAVLEFNTTGDALSATIGATSFAYTASDRRQFLAVNGTAELGLSTAIGSVTLAGTFGFERASIFVNDVATTVIKVTIDNASTSLIAGDSSTGVKIAATGIRGAFLIRSDGVAGFLKVDAFALTKADGSPLPGLTVAAVRNVVIGVNTTGTAIKASIGSYYFDYSAVAHHDFFNIQADIDLTLTVGPVAFTLSGRFGLTKVTLDIAGTPTSAFLVALTNITTALTIGSAPGGAMLKLSGISGAIVIANVNGTYGAAGFLKVGAVSLTEADGVTPLIGDFGFLNLNLPLQFNLFDLGINLDLPGINLNFGAFPYIDLSIPSLPDIYLPNFSLPSLSLPDFAAYLPSFNLPSLTLPNISLPSFSFPSINFSLPSFDLNLNFSLPEFHNFISLSGLLDFKIGDFITFSGTFKFKRVGDEIIIVATAVSGSLALGDFSVGITDGALGLVIKKDRTVSLEVSGGLVLNGGGFANASVDSIKFQYNTSGINYAATPRTLTVDGVSATLTAASGTRANPFSSLTAFGLAVDIAGLVRVSGDFSFSKGFTADNDPVIKVAVRNLSTSIGDGTTTFVAVTNGSGAILVSSVAGVSSTAAKITATVSLSGIPGIAMAPSTFTLEFNTGAAAVNESFVLGADTIALNLAAGSFVRVIADPFSLTVMGVAMSGRISFEQSRNTGGDKVTILTADNISIAAFGGAGSGGSPVSITDASGFFVLSASGVAGKLSFIAAVDFGGFGAGANMVLEFNNTGAAVSATGPFGALALDAGNYTRILLLNLTITFPGITVEGDFRFETVVIDGVSQTVIVGNNVHIFVGTGEDATRVGFELTAGSAVFIRTNGQVAGFVKGTVALLGVPGVTVSGTMTLRLNNTGSAVSRSFVLDGETIAIEFSAEETLGFIQFEASAFTFNIGGVLALTGDLLFTRTSAGFSFSVSSGTLFPGQAFTASVTGAAGVFTLATKAFALTLDSFSLNLGDALALTATSVAFNYDPANAAADATVATLASAQLTSPLLSGLGALTLTAVVIRKNGFHIADTTYSPEGGAVSFGSFINLAGFSLNIDDLDVTFGSGAPTVTGTFTATASDLVLFPNSTLFTTQVTGLVITYDLGLGASSAAWRIDVATFKLTFGQVFALSATAIEITPGSDTLVTIATASASFPQFAALPAATLTGIVVTRTGFSITSLTATATGGVNLSDSIGAVLNFDTVTFNLDNFVFTYGTTPAVSGTATLTVTGAKLFPGFTFLKSTFGTINAFYDLADNASLKIEVASLDISIGEALALHLGAITIEPTAEVMASIASITVDSPLFPALSGSIADFQLRRTGFSIASLALSISSADISGVISLTNLRLNVTDFVLDRSSVSTPVSGLIALQISSISLFPGSSFITTSAQNISTQFDLSSALSTGRLSITIGGLDITIAGALRLSALNIVLYVGDDTTLATVASARLTFLILDEVEATVSDLVIRRDGFSFSDASVTIDSFSVGGILNLGTVAATLTDFDYTQGSGGSISGVLSVTAGASSLDLGGILTASITDGNSDGFAVTGTYDLSTKAFGLTLDHATLGIAGLLNAVISNATITYSPEGNATQELLVVASAAVTIIPLNNATATIQNLRVRKDGFSIESATGTMTSFSLGSLLTLQAPTISLTDVSYTTGGTLQGYVGLSVGNTTLTLGSVLTLAITDSNSDADTYAIQGGYNLSTKVFELSLDTISLTIGSFATLGAAGAALNYDPNATGSGRLVIGAIGVTGSATDAASLTDGSFILVTFGDGTYAFQGKAMGSISLGGASASGQLSITSNTSGDAAYGQSITVASTVLSITLQTNGDSVTTSGLRIGLGDAFVLTGDFSYTSDVSFSGYSFRRISVTNGSIELAVGAVKLTAGAITGVLLENADGVVGKLSVGVLTLQGLTGFSLNFNAITLEANTTGHDISGTFEGQELSFTGERSNFKSIVASSTVPATAPATGTVPAPGTVNLTLGGVSLGLNGTFAFDLFTTVVNGVSTQVIRAGVTDGSLTLLVGDDTGPKLAATGISGAFLLNEKGAAGSLTVGSLALTGVTGVTLSVTDSKISFNNTGVAASATIGGNSFAYTAADQFDFLSVSGTMSLGVTIGGLSASIAGTIGFQKTSLLINGASQSIFSVSVASGSTNLSAGGVGLALTGINGAVLIRNTGVAASLTVGGLVVSGLPAVTFSGSALHLDFNNTNDNVSAVIGGTTLDFTTTAERNFLIVSGTLTVGFTTDAASASLSGEFLFAKLDILVGGVSETVMVLQAVDASLRLTVGSAPNGASLGFAGITGLLVLRNNGPNAGLAGHLQVASAALTKADGVTPLSGLTLALSGVTLDINTTGAGIAADVNGVTFDFSDSAKHSFLAVTGTASLGISLGAISATLSGTFGFQRSTVTVDGVDSAIIELSVTDGSTSLSAGGVTFALGGITGGLLLTDGGLAGQVSIGSAALTGVTGVTFAGSALKLSVNTTGRDISATIGATTFTFAGSEQQTFLGFGGTVSLGLSAGAVSATLAGTFEFQRSSLLVNGVASTVIKVGVTGGATSLAVGSVSLAITGITGGFILTNKGVAGSLAVGSAALSGVSGVTLAVTSVSLQLNTTGAAASATIGTTTFAYTTADRFTFFKVGGSLTLGVSASGGSIDIAGTIDFERASLLVNGVASTVIKVAISNASTSLTVGSSSGVKIAATGISGAILINPQGVAGVLEVGGFALTRADGSALSGLSVAAVRSVVIGFNTTSTAVSASIGTYTFDYSALAYRSFFSISADLDLALTTSAGGFTLSGRFGFSKISPNIGGSAQEVFLVTIANASTSLTVGSAPGGARLALTGINGAFIIGTLGGVSAAAGSLQVASVTLTAADGVTPLAGGLVFAVTDLKFQFNLFAIDVTVSQPGVNLATSAFPYTNSANATTVTAATSTSSAIAIAFAGAAQRNFLAISGTVSLDVGGFITLNGTFGFKSISGGTEIIIVASNVSAALTLGDFSVGLNTGSLALLVKSNGTIALEAGGALLLQGGGFANASVQSIKVQYNTTGINYSVSNRTLDVNGVTGTLSMVAGSLASPFLGLTAFGLLVDIGGGVIRVGGDFSFSRGVTTTGTSIIKVAVANFSTALGDGTTDFVTVTSGTGAFLITSAGLAASVTATVSLQNVPGVSINSSTFTLAINTTTAAVNETFSIGSNTYTLAVRAGPYVSVTANPLSVTVLGVTMTGKFAFEQYKDTAGARTVVVSASNVSIGSFTGEGAGSSGISITDARGVFVLNSYGFAGTLSFTTSVALEFFDAGATIKLEMNNTNRAVYAAGAFGTIQMEAGNFTRLVLNDLSISFPGVEIEGDFSFKSAVVNGVSVQVIVGTNVRVFVGDTSGARVGLELTDGEAFFLNGSGGKAGYITGRVTLVGVDGLTITANMTLRINETTAAVNETVILDGKTITLAFSGSEIGVAGSPFIQFKAEAIHFSVLDVIELYGNFTFTRTASQFSIGVSGGELFVGSGPLRLESGALNPSAIGLRIYDLNLAMLVFTGGSRAGKYAFRGDGAVGFAGLSGLDVVTNSVSLRFGFALNKTGAALNVAVPGAGTNLVFTDGSDLPIFSGSLTISVAGSFILSGTVTVQPRTGGLVSIKIPDATLSIGTQFSISGAGSFELTPATGFRMVDFRITSAVVAGTDLGALVNAFNYTPLTATLSSPYNNSIVNRVTLNTQKYIDVTFAGDVNATTINGDEFKIYRSGVQVNLGTVTVTKVSGDTWRYSFTGTFAADGDYVVEFQANTWTDNAAHANAKSTQTFAAYDPNPATISLSGGSISSTGQLGAPPTAQLTSISAGALISPDALNKLGYIDVTFVSRDGNTIDLATINGGEIVLSGAGVLDAAVRAGSPTRISGTTYRYYLIDKNSTNATAKFGAGDVTVTFVAGSFATLAS
ncbi:MAG TPA: hypothetical protein VIO38_02935, partial [Rariglobus sp.]